MAQDVEALVRRSYPAAPVPSEMILVLSRSSFFDALLCRTSSCTFGDLQLALVRTFELEAFLKMTSYLGAAAQPALTSSA